MNNALELAETARPRVGGARRRTLLVNVGVYALLGLGALVMAGPFAWMVATALKTPAQQFSRALLPNPATLANFRQLWTQLPFTVLLGNSLKIALLSTIGQVLTCAMAAFAFAVVRFRFRQALFLALLATLMIPPQVTLVPNFILFKWLGLIGTQTPLWLPGFWGGAFGTFLLRQYFLTVPFDLAESARIDGASLMRIFWSIYLPLARPAVAALALFSFMASWNDLLGPLIYLPTDLSQTTITVGLALFQTQYAGRWTIMMAGALVSIAPVLALFMVAQRQFIEGIALSGVKR
jgi:ABC-type glycerol-3-phosphate transport system permease component